MAATSAQAPTTHGFQFLSVDNTSLIAAADLSSSAAISSSIRRMASSSAAMWDEAASRVRWRLPDQAMGVLVNPVARGRILACDGFRQERVVIHVHGLPLENYLTGGAYWIPPCVHSAFKPRGMLSLDCVPTFLSKISP